jgi:hypothetical protein
VRTAVSCGDSGTGRLPSKVSSDSRNAEGRPVHSRARVR